MWFSDKSSTGLSQYYNTTIYRQINIQYNQNGHVYADKPDIVQC